MLESLFEPISEYEPRAEDWDPKKELRLRRLEDVIIPSILAHLDDIGENGRRFTQTVLNKLRESCTTPAEDLYGNHLLPLFVLFFGGRSFYDAYEKITTPPIPPNKLTSYRLTDGHGKPFDPYIEHVGTGNVTLQHNPQTIKAANVVLSSLTPRLGVSIFDTPEAVLERAVELRDLDLAYITNAGKWIRFATILPGVCIRHVFSKPNPLRGPGWVLRRFDIEIWRPDQHQYYYPHPGLSL